MTFYLAPMQVLKKLELPPQRSNSILWRQGQQGDDEGDEDGFEWEVGANRN